MAGIYIHIPYCKKACHYCNFHFSTTHSLLPQMVDAIVAEVLLQKEYLHENIATIYFGGGTPSLLATDDLRLIVSQICSVFLVNNNVEITLEANPDDITEDKLLAWKNIGINRLSIGIQSFVEDDLRWMNRAHSASQAIKSIQLAQQFGFANITIDLIYGTPTLTNDQWQANVQTAINLGITHLSCYALTVEPKTALNKMIEQQKIANVDAEKQAHHFELLMQWLAAAGYEHYEISNFAKPGHRSKHNSAYWQGKNYLGIGPSAHSFNGKSRQWNIANNALYMAGIALKTVPFTIEELTETQQLNEYIMTSLRTIDGISLQYIGQIWGEDIASIILQNAQPFIQSQSMILHEYQLQLTNAGKLLADGISADLFQ
ncbi:MAG: radical SAM family heme chaperone HemW [Deinococcales bacterium]|nr:radical SAM family heme chaperone HemW [Chitinophagaceae bacterium]